MVISMDQWKGKVAVVAGTTADNIGAVIMEQLVGAGLKNVDPRSVKTELVALAELPAPYPDDDDDDDDDDYDDGGDVCDCDQYGYDFSDDCY